MNITIYERDKQKLFDAMLGHMRQQGKPAVARLDHIDKCLYRTEDGLKCALGALIPDELYKPGFEKEATSVVLDQLSIWDTDLKEFLTAAQNRLHDEPAGIARMVGEDSFLNAVERSARNLAMQFSLTYTAPEPAQ